MSSHVNIALGNEFVGTVVFTQPDPNFSASLTASGFRLSIPAVVTFLPPSASQSPLLLENLRVTFHHEDGGRQIEIGVAEYESTLQTSVRELPITFTWDWTRPTLAAYEKMRAGREARFRLTVSGDIRYVLLPNGSSPTGREACSVARRFFQWDEVSYSQRLWTSMMRDLGLKDSVLVEIPFPSDPPTGWEPVWVALRDARDSFDHGGATGWKGAIVGVRLALEEWRKIEPEDKGPTDPHQRTKLQRTDNIRWHLIQLAHFAAHTKAEEWTRDDAVLMLSTLCSLLAVRKP